MPQVRVKEKIAYPTKYYHHPKEVVEDKGISNTAKIKILENWLDDINLLNIATEENMVKSNVIQPEKPKDFTAEINKALSDLNNNNSKYH